MDPPQIRIIPLDGFTPDEVDQMGSTLGILWLAIQYSSEGSTAQFAEKLNEADMELVQRYFNLVKGTFFPESRKAPSIQPIPLADPVQPFSVDPTQPVGDKQFTDWA